MKKILVIQPIHEEGINLLKDNSDFEYEVVDNIDTEFLKSKIKDCDGISIRTAKLSGEVIEAANNLKIISRGSSTEIKSLISSTLLSLYFVILYLMSI